MASKLADTEPEDEPVTEGGVCAAGYQLQKAEPKTIVPQGQVPSGGGACLYSVLCACSQYENFVDVSFILN